MHHPSMLGFIATALAGSALAVPFHDENDAHLAPLITPTAPPMGGPLSHLSIQGGRSPSDYLIRDNYIVVFKKGTSEHHTKHKEKVHKLWKRDQQQRIQSDSYGPTDLFSEGEDSVDSFKGYSIHVPQALISIIRSFPEVDYVERDSRVWINEQYDNPSTIPVAEKSAHSTSEPIDVEYGAPWGLARISHRHKLKFSTFNVYPFEDPAGLGVDAYVIDTGVNIEHEDLEGRAIWGKTIPDDPDKDLNGHGSHVAGTIAGRTYGVAKNATIIAVKVLGAGGSGTMSDVVAGVVWAAEAAATKARDEAAKKGLQAQRQCCQHVPWCAVDTGLHFAVAAGNDNKDACTFSPAAAKKPITVGASTIQDERAYFSNHGKCVDIFAPGLNIKSIWNTGKHSVNTISGTSMASPHIAGLAAYFLSIYPEKLDLASLGVFEDEQDEFVAANGEAYDLGQYLSWNSVSSQGQLAFGKFKEVVGYGGATKSDDGSQILSTKMLKKAMIKMATSGVLSKLPGHTCNSLAYNNATLA
ncbi:hypothetical protein PSTT_10918 [Puccinia striiformis]|uniref:Peptidase S8/S53 domain-containing protein n=1 Tax=Puccinia striiformis TaxID=27350 RepID=A0A2S4V2I5_9BASI|nr:hypothetical protein PSTT_10918 [Puccinia striiformis]